MEQQKRKGDIKMTNEIKTTTESSSSGKTPLNLFQKLIEVRKQVPYLQKKQKGYQFNYVSSSQTIQALRGEMDRQNLLLMPFVEQETTTEHRTAKGTLEFFTKLTILFTWINADNPVERLICKWVGFGVDTGEKGVGKALTYAEKYFLLKFFNIATDISDPDLIANKKLEVKERPKPMPTELIGLFNEKEIMKAKRDAMWMKALEMTNNDVVKATGLLTAQLKGEIDG